MPRPLRKVEALPVAKSRKVDFGSLLADVQRVLGPQTGPGFSGIEGLPSPEGLKKGFRC